MAVDATIEFNVAETIKAWGELDSGSQNRFIALITILVVFALAMALIIDRRITKKQTGKAKNRSSEVKQEYTGHKSFEGIVKISKK